FGACGTGNQVAVAFSNPTTDGTNFRGNTSPLGYGTPVVKLVSDDPSPSLTHFKYEVIHEFGHALGFAHEMQRPDNWVGDTPLQCRPTRGDTGTYASAPGGIYLTATYDPNSVMNYCTPAGYPTQLSVGDILGASRVTAYGANPGCSFGSGATAC